MRPHAAAKEQVIRSARGASATHAVLGGLVARHRHPGAAGGRSSRAALASALRGGGGRRFTRSPCRTNRRRSGAARHATRRAIPTRSILVPVDRAHASVRRARGSVARGSIARGSVARGSVPRGRTKRGIALRLGRAARGGGRPTRLTAAARQRAQRRDVGIRKSGGGRRPNLGELGAAVPLQNSTAHKWHRAVVLVARPRPAVFTAN